MESTCFICKPPVLVIVLRIHAYLNLPFPFHVPTPSHATPTSAPPPPYPILLLSFAYNPSGISLCILSLRCFPSSLSLRHWLSVLWSVQSLQYPFLSSVLVLSSPNLCNQKSYLMLSFLSLFPVLSYLCFIPSRPFVPCLSFCSFHLYSSFRPQTSVINIHSSCCHSPVFPRPLILMFHPFSSLRPLPLSPFYSHLYSSFHPQTSVINSHTSCCHPSALILLTQFLPHPLPPPLQIMNYSTFFLFPCLLKKEKGKN